MIALNKALSLFLSIALLLGLAYSLGRQSAPTDQKNRALLRQLRQGITSYITLRNEYLLLKEQIADLKQELRENQK